MASRYNPEIHRRRSIRLKGYEYSRPGTYFVTICTRDRECLFGNVSDGQMVLNNAGRIIERAWKDLPTRFPSVELDVFGVMPNHVHGIIAIVGAGLAPPKTKGAASSAPTLGDVVRAFKSISAIRVNRHLSRSGQPLWQRNYYEHIIRTDDEQNRIQQYIRDNPMGWLEDRENPSARVKKVQEPWRV
jgi:REP element-mobilizing transposase RayT